MLEAGRVLFKYYFSQRGTSTKGGHLFEGQRINFSIYGKYTTIGTFCDTLKSFSRK